MKFYQSAEEWVKVRIPEEEIGVSEPQMQDCAAKKEENNEKMSEPYLYHTRILAFNPCDKHAGGLH